MNIQILPISSLVEDPKNARVHPERNLRTIRQSLQEFGQVEPLIVRKDTHAVIGGNGRLRMMRELGWTEVQVTLVDFDDTKATALGLALNRSGDLAEWDYGQLSELIADIADQEVDLSTLGWEPFEVDQLLTATWDPPAIDLDYESPNPTAAGEEAAPGLVIELTAE